MKNNDKEFEKKLETMSPFEIKNRLIAYAQESFRKSTPKKVGWNTIRWIFGLVSTA